MSFCISIGGFNLYHQFVSLSNIGQSSLACKTSCGHSLLRHFVPAQTSPSKDCFATFSVANGNGIVSISIFYIKIILTVGGYGVSPLVKKEYLYHFFVFQESCMYFLGVYGVSPWDFKRGTLLHVRKLSMLCLVSRQLGHST